jgi:hypothetical protein
MDWYRVIKKINGHRYYYWQKTYRAGKQVKTLNKYIGPVDKVPRPAARLASSPKGSVNAGMTKKKEEATGAYEWADMRLRMHDAHSLELKRVGAIEKIYCDKDGDDFVHSQTSKGGVTTKIHPDGRITNTWDDGTVYEPTGTIDGILHNLAFIGYADKTRIIETALRALEYEPHEIHEVFGCGYNETREFAKAISGLDTLPKEDDGEYSDVYVFESEFCKNAEAILDAISSSPQMQELKQRALKKRRQRTFRMENWRTPEEDRRLTASVCMKSKEGAADKKGYEIPEEFRSKLAAVGLATLSGLDEHRWYAYAVEKGINLDAYLNHAKSLEHPQRDAFINRLVDIVIGYNNDIFPPLLTEHTDPAAVGNLTIRLNHLKSIPNPTEEQKKRMRILEEAIREMNPKADGAEFPASASPTRTKE